MRNLLVTVDGSCMRRRMGVGVIVRDADTREILHETSKRLGWGTSCRAEWHALLAACTVVRGLFFGASVVIYTDSQLVYRQLSGEYRVRDKHLRPLYQAAVQQLKELKARVRWHRRDTGDGPLADKLANMGGRRASDDRVSMDTRRHRRNVARENARRRAKSNSAANEEKRRCGQDVCVAPE